MIITGMYYYRKGTIRLSGFSAKTVRPFASDRGVIKKMSSKSKQRLALYVAETKLEFKTMITLTYPAHYKITGQEAKNDLNKMLRYLRGEFPLVGYLWFMEFTKKGQIHFHLLIDTRVLSYEKSGIVMFWTRQISKSVDDLEPIHFAHSQPGVIEDVRKSDGAKRYALKYALKSESKEVPTRFCGIGRFWGMNKKVKDSIPKPEFVRINESDFREFLKGTGNPMYNTDRFPLIIFNRENVSRETIGQNMDNNQKRA